MGGKGLGVTVPWMSRAVLIGLAVALGPCVDLIPGAFCIEGGSFPVCCTRLSALFVLYAVVELAAAAVEGTTGFAPVPRRKLHLPSALAVSGEAFDRAARGAPSPWRAGGGGGGGGAEGGGISTRNASASSFRSSSVLHASAVLLPTSGRKSWQRW